MVMSLIKTDNTFIKTLFDGQNEWWQPSVSLHYENVQACPGIRQCQLRHSAEGVSYGLFSLVFPRHAVFSAACPCSGPCASLQSCWEHNQWDVPDGWLRSQTSGALTMPVNFSSAFPRDSFQFVASCSRL